MMEIKLFYSAKQKETDCKSVPAERTNSMTLPNVILNKIFVYAFSNSRE